MFPQIANSLPNPSAASETAHYASSGLTHWTGKSQAFFVWPYFPMAFASYGGETTRTASQLGSVQARSGSCNSACSASGLGQGTGPRLEPKSRKGQHFCILSLKRPSSSLGSSLGTLPTSPWSLALRLLPPFPTSLPTCCTPVLLAFPICSPLSHLPSILHPSPGWAHLLPRSKEDRAARASFSHRKNPESQHSLGFLCARLC